MVNSHSITYSWCLNNPSEKDLFTHPLTLGISPWPKTPQTPPYRGQPQPFGVADGRSTQVHLAKGEGLGGGETGGFCCFFVLKQAPVQNAFLFFLLLLHLYKSSFPPIFNQVKTVPYRKIELGKLSIDLSFEKQTSNPSLQQQESPLRKT